MMGAGEDPLKKNQDFAHLTGDLPTLMKTTFQFPQKSVMRSLPVLDVFSRTLGCPIATQRQNPLVAARIGSHLSLPTQHFYITEEGVQIVVNASKALIGRK